MLSPQLTEFGEGQIVLAFGSIVVAIITTVGLIAIALINRTRQHAKAASDNTAKTRDEFTNDHKVNLRDDLDEKFAGLEAQMRKQGSQINGRLDRQARQINKLFANDRDLADELEQTRPGKAVTTRRKTP